VSRDSQIYTSPTKSQSRGENQDLVDGRATGGSVRARRGAHRVRTQLQMPSHGAPSLSEPNLTSGLQDPNLIAKEVSGQPTEWTHSPFIIRHLQSHP